LRLAKQPVTAAATGLATDPPQAGSAATRGGSGASEGYTDYPTLEGAALGGP